MFEARFAFLRLLIDGLRKDWQHSLAVILVILGMFSTPLVLGSVRNRVYVAVKEQIEKENNAREIRYYPAKDRARPIDPAFRADLAREAPEARVVANHKLIVSVEGPAGSDLATLQTLEPGDPREAHLAIVPGVPEDFGLFDLIVSDALGRQLFGELWATGWPEASSDFAGPPLALRVNDLPVGGSFRVVARRTLPGKGLYGSPALGQAIRRYSRGFGAVALALPADRDLLRLALPPVLAESCRLYLDRQDRTCRDSDREVLRRRFRDLSWTTQPVEAGEPMPEAFDAWRVKLAERGESGTAPLDADCRESLGPQLVEFCRRAQAVPELELEMSLHSAGQPGRRVVVAALPAELRELLPAADALRDRFGAGTGRADALELALPHEWGLPIGADVELAAAAGKVPAKVASLFRCAQGPCRAFSGSLEVARLRQWTQGRIDLVNARSFLFNPANVADEPDELLVYAPAVEAVEPLVGRLKTFEPGYAVEWNAAAIDKLRRQNDRLTALFALTSALTALFVLLAVGAVARINIERRNRQMAQLLILGFTRAFVRVLVVAEYALLVLGAAALAWVSTDLLCRGARSLFANERAGEARDFSLIVQAMAVDAKAFAQVLAVIALSTGIVALVSAWRAAQADPLDLLD